MSDLLRRQSRNTAVVRELGCGVEMAGRDVSMSDYTHSLVPCVMPCSISAGPRAARSCGFAMVLTPSASLSEPQGAEEPREVRRCQNCGGVGLLFPHEENSSGMRKKKSLAFLMYLLFFHTDHTQCRLVVLPACAWLSMEERMFLQH